MRDLLPDLDHWRRQGTRIALARIVALEGSGPRPAGAVMAVTQDSLVAGSISGGCVESAVVEGPGAGASLLLPDPLKGQTVRPAGSLGDPELDRVVARDAAGELAVGASRIRTYGRKGEALRDDVSVFIESFVAPARC